MNVLFHAKIHSTVVTFLMYLGLKVTTWVLVDIISNSLSNIIKCTMTRYYKQKYLRFSSKNTSKIMKKKKIFWIQQGLNRGPWDYEAWMLVKSHGDLLLQSRLFHWCNHNSLISVDFCTSYFPLRTASEKTAKIPTWQLDFLWRWQKVGENFTSDPFVFWKTIILAKKEHLSPPISRDILLAPNLTKFLT